MRNFNKEMNACFFLHQVETPDRLTGEEVGYIKSQLNVDIMFLTGGACVRLCTYSYPLLLI